MSTKIPSFNNNQASDSFGLSRVTFTGTSLSVNDLGNGSQKLGSTISTSTSLNNNDQPSVNKNVPISHNRQLPQTGNTRNSIGILASGSLLVALSLLLRSLKHQKGE